MQLELTLFYMFSAFALFSALMVINAANPVNSVLFLILVFCNASALLILLNAEFLALIFLIVYVGAIAVLFLFVVMMLNIQIVELKQHFIKYLPIGAIVGFIFLLEIYLILNYDLTTISNFNGSDSLMNAFNNQLTQLHYTNWVNVNAEITNIEIIGHIMYTHYFYLFLLCGMILLVSMIAAIILTVYRNRFVHKQREYEQMSRNSREAIYFVRQQ
uniref:NADH-ubiquinone oxidoreductase chain 6 n=1 Tax=Ancoracysta twista TaxID=2044563 RepID=A0A2H4R8F1_9EUKA|nr:NADH dehydrogenase subunit 6 [Ancoracysta twista]ATY40929.1 NADH dehydrogenase subunit 6 [Ancoracysta twista]